MARSFLPCHNAVITAAGPPAIGKDSSFQNIAFAVRRARGLLTDWI
jgi:hypothetical protein